MAWKTGILSFENSSMEYVCQILSEHFEVPVIMDLQGILYTKRLTATYDNKELEEILKILSLTLDISCESTSDSITLISSPR
jgi:ferric-dicitrate binding protein FerR (iron transport regulator)